MKKYIGTIFLLPLLVFNACGDDDDDTGGDTAAASFTNCFDGNDTYGPCTTCGYYVNEEDAQGAADCITCPSGYEIDVAYDDCTGYCVEEGTATNPLSSSDCTTP